MNLVASRMGYWSAYQRHIFVGIIDDHYYVSGASGGKAQYGKPGIAMHGYNFADGGAATGQIFTHEMGHNFNLRHAPSPNAADADPNYPYSGNGLSAGYAFSGVYQHFNREINQNWDHMSYWGSYDNRWRYFSDYNYRFLQSQMGTGEGDVGSTPVPLTLPKTPEGTYVWGKAEFKELKHWVQAHIHRNDVCEMPPPPVVGEHGQFLTRTPMGSSGDLLLPAFNSMGPMSLTSPTMAPIFEPNSRGGNGAMDCWTGCKHVPKYMSPQHTWMTVNPDAP